MGKTKKGHSSNSPADDREDLVQLLPTNNSPPSEEEIISLLSARFKADLPYTRINASSLVVINPNKPLESMNDASAKEYAEQWYKNTTGEKITLQPHIYELAAKVYFHMRRSAEDQCVVFSGIDGSGKTETESHLLSQLLLLSTHTKKEAKIANQIQNAQTILQAFGNAKSIHNINASRFGKYLELQFSERGRIVGAKFLTYCFDKARVSDIPIGERSYHVFYYLLAGATPEERSLMHLQDPQNYLYLSKSKCYKINGMDDSIQMDDLRASLKTLGFKSKTITQIWQILTAILLLGNIEFISPGKAKDEAATIKNRHVLELAAQYLGVPAFKLEQTLTFKNKLIGKELCTVFLDAEAAVEQRDSLSQVLYSILFTWIVEHINSKLIQSDEPPNFIGLLDQPGYQNFEKNSFEQFCLNFATEEIENYILKRLFDDNFGINSEITNDNVSLPNVSTTYNNNCVELLRGNDSDIKRSFISILDSESAKFQNATETVGDSTLLSALKQAFSSHHAFVSNPPSSKLSSKSGVFGINHFAGLVVYEVNKFIEKNIDNLSPDVISLFKETNNTFIRKLFSGPALAIESHPKNEKTVVAAQLPTKPMRAPSMKRSKRNQSSEAMNEKESKKKQITHVSTVATQLYGTLNQLIDTLNSTRMWNVFQIRPNDNNDPNTFDAKRIKSQIHNFLIPEITARKKVEYSMSYTFNDFLDRYRSIIQPHNLESSRNPRQKVEEFALNSGWPEGSYAIGHQNVYLSDSTWKSLEDILKTAEKEDRSKTKFKDDESVAGGIHLDDGQNPHLLSAASSMDRLIPRSGFAYAGSEVGFYEESEEDYQYSKNSGMAEDEEGSMWGSEWDGKSDGHFPANDQVKDGEKNVENEKSEDIEELPITKTRRYWVAFVWLITWWIPSFLLKWVGKMKRSDIQMAWREKFTLCFLIFLLSAFIVFYIVFFGDLLCPGTDKIYSSDEVAFHKGDNDFWVSVRGVVYDLSKFHLTNHAPGGAQPADAQGMEPYAGMDVTVSIPIPLSQPETCGDMVTNDLVSISHKNLSDPTIGFMFIHTSGQQTTLPNTHLADTRWYFDYFLPTMNLYKKADLVWNQQQFQTLFSNGHTVVYIKNKIYDFTNYFATQVDQQQPSKPDYTTPQPAGAIDWHWLDEPGQNVIEQLIKTMNGQDITKNLYSGKLNSTRLSSLMRCLDSVFYIGRADFRDSFRCKFNSYVLLVAAVIMSSVIVVKFLAALQLGAKRKPEDHDKFVICQVPCYTEGEDSLKRTMDSLAALTYDDKRKLLFFIADGMIVGSGNDRPTPRIVLDLLGVDPKIDPEPLAFKSIGESSKQLNYGKVYSGLYEYEGHVVPYIVVVKVGKPTEKNRPGNRGKRDSQIILMRFLNRVHFELEMSPLELEIYHQMKNVIGVNPSFYEYVLMVDADTEVLPDSLNRMISCMLHDGRIIGICGETTLVNEEGSWTTMIQVYEYYISHHLAKAFESLFGSVTCLPGCFCMYRIRTPIKSKPLIIASEVIDEYSENHVDTLHKKNLLSLGEDRYLTTLMMKHFPQYKMTFTPDAYCKTAAPDRWSILLSQRRRWINSTIHNLMELLFLPEMCGFCCFSMRFVVFIDLFGTLILPSTTIYIIYLIYAVATKRQDLPKIALIMLAAVYGLQAIIFILKRQWQHIGWMIIYLMAFPLFSFFIPIYSFWHFDDFSWGNTRVVVGEKGKKQIITTDEEKFDESMVPKKKWADYEQEMWEVGTSDSHSSGRSRNSATSYRSGSQRNYENGSQYGGSNYDGDYFRDTNLTAPSPVDRRGRSRSPVPRYAPSDSRNSRSFSAVGDHDYRNSIISMPRSNSEMDVYPPQGPTGSYGGSHDYDGPTDEEILMEIRNILQSANLMNITKKQVREQLSIAFGMDMSYRKEFINNSIELILQGKL
ncbi:glycosyltransferase family 2 protein [Gigaspora margarita]|uniref:chitin synthase n=1 Tax=Gigaspora margarita TaxID=4874 RepID=A0A8H4A8G8_GIGMA|nr:glycosyltransferase family 2 protein [Gigaspora margarita]